MKYVEKETKVSFKSKEQYTCPLCEYSFHREELLTGGGRLIAGKLTDELHRLYEPSAKYGNVYPLIYTATVCPLCWFASDARDFELLPSLEKHAGVEDKKKRIADTKSIFPDLDFEKNRSLVSGTASQFLVVKCYDYYPKEFSPTMKQGIASLRAAWLFDEMHKKFPGQHFDWLSELFKKKAAFFYNEAVHREIGGKENLSGVKIFGPDTDKNYAYEGALYLASLLNFKYCYLDNPDQRRKILDEAKRTIAKIFGIGKTTKSKPGPLLEHARNLYENISKELKEADI